MKFVFDPLMHDTRRGKNLDLSKFVSKKRRRDNRVIARRNSAERKILRSECPMNVREQVLDTKKDNVGNLSLGSYA